MAKADTRSRGPRSSPRFETASKTWLLINAVIRVHIRQATLATTRCRTGVSSGSHITNVLLRYAPALAGAQAILSNISVSEPQVYRCVMTRLSFRGTFIRAMGEHGHTQFR